MIDFSKVLPVGTVLRSGSRAYTIVEVLGQGGFGITYRATAMLTVDNIDIEVQFAIKEHFVDEYCERDGVTVAYSRPVANKVENSRKDFLSEARRLRDLSKGKKRHPNIVCVNETFEANNTAYFVMEYLNGESMSSCVKRRGPLSDSEVRRVMAPIIDAVAFLHREYITHLDIKPANIMLTYDKTGKLRPVLIDFGLSRHFDPDTDKPSSSIQQAGFSEGYAPVEQVQAFKHFSPGTDVYSLGATMLYALTGKTPSAAEDLDDETLRHSIPAGLSESTIATITAAMHHFRKERPTDAGALLSILTDGGYTRPIDDDPIIPDIYMPKSKKGLYIGIAVVALLAVLCAVWLINGGFFGQSVEPRAEETKTEQTTCEVVGEAEKAAEEPIPAPKTEDPVPSEKPAPAEAPAPAKESAPAPAPEKPKVEEISVKPHKTPHHLDLAVRYNGERGYFSSDEWASLSSSEKSRCRKIGMVVSAEGQRFIVELHDRNGGRKMYWDDAMREYSTVMPTTAQGEALASIGWDTWKSRMRAYGGDATECFWTKEEYDSTCARLVHMRFGIVSEYQKKIKSEVKARAVKPF